MLKQERRAEQTGSAPTTRIRPGRGAKREVSIWQLLVWAFQVERVTLDFDAQNLSRMAGERPGVGMEYILMQRRNLGCAVDGGGTSDSHPDADLVADAVAALPEWCGGSRMALSIAEAARAGIMPDWGSIKAPRCQPVTWKNHWRGPFAEKTLWTGQGRWPANQLGRDDGYVCLVTYSGTAAHVAGMRRAWLAWWGALLELRVTFQTMGLTAFSVSNDMPPQAPWKENPLTRM